MIVGLDIGNITSVAVSEEKTFITESRAKAFEELNNFANADIVEVGGKTLIFGEGDFENNILKHEKENFLDLVFYCLYKVTGENAKDINLVIGVPAGQYNTEKENIKNIIKGNCCKSVSVNGERKTIVINDVFVVPEGYGVKIETKQLENNKAKTLIVDIGGGTTDVAEFNELGKFTGGKSVKLGLIDIYKEVMETLDKNYKLSVPLEDAKKYFDGELDVRNEEFEVETEYKKEILLKFIKKLFNNLKGLYPNIKQYNIILCGGGAEKVYPAFKKLLPQTKIEDEIDANARGFRKVGLAKWQKQKK